MTCLKFGTLEMMVVHWLLYIYTLFSPDDSTYRAPSLHSLMCTIGCLLSIIPHVGEILLEMLTVDSYWELDTIQLLKHICISELDLVNSIWSVPIWRPFSKS
jgi:Ni/Fe-hydrogenase subunit HybB-like protein